MKAEQDIVNREAILQRKDSAVTCTVIQYTYMHNVSQKSGILNCLICFYHNKQT